MTLMRHRARDDEEFTDLTIICEETKLAVHKVVICTQSSVFHAACTGPYKVGDPFFSNALC